MAREDAELMTAKARIGAGLPVPFLYDSEQQCFRVGDDEIDIHDMGSGRFSMANRTPLSPEEVDQLMGSETVVHLHRGLTTLPIYHSFVRDEWSSELQQETVDAMVMAMAETLPSDATPEFRRSVRSGVGFSAMCIDRELGRVIFNVLGDCACFGPDATVSGWGSSLWRHGIMVNTEHNIHIPAQRIALMAGLGHVGFRALRQYSE